jgi:hypothetical protein
LLRIQGIDLLTIAIPLFCRVWYFEIMKKLIPSLLLLFVSPLWALNIVVDFESAATTPTGNWNEIASPGTVSNLIDFDTGLATSVGLTLSGGVSDSSSTGQWGSRTASPSWSVADALSDRFFVTEGGTGTLTITGLTPGMLYDIEIASSYGGAGTSGNDDGVYELTDANGLVEGFNAFTSGSPGGVEGWLGWYDAEANGSGELSFALSAPAGANPRIALNAMQITAIPEPGTLALIGIALGAAGLVGFRRRR